MREPKLHRLVRKLLSQYLDIFHVQKFDDLPGSAKEAWVGMERLIGKEIRQA